MLWRVRVRCLATAFLKSVCFEKRVFEKGGLNSMKSASTLFSNGFLEKRFFEKRVLNSMKSASTLFSNGFLEKCFLKSEVSMLRTGFYLGYLRGRSFTPKMPSFPPPQILLSLQCISNYIGKIIQTRRGQCTWSTYSLSKDTIRQIK